MRPTIIDSLFFLRKFKQFLLQLKQEKPSDFDIDIFNSARPILKTNCCGSIRGTYLSSTLQDLYVMMGGSPLLYDRPPCGGKNILLLIAF